MRVLDTSAWIEWMIDSPIARRLGVSVPTPGEWIVPTIVQFELCKWLKRELGAEALQRGLAYTQICHVVALDTHIAVSAAELSALHKLSAADALIYATALDQDANLLTCDAHFEGLSGVTYVAKG